MGKLNESLLRKSGIVRIADTTASAHDESLDPSDWGVLDLDPPTPMRLGANLAAGIPTEDPDARQFWIWDSDPLEEEPCP